VTTNNWFRQICAKAANLRVIGKNFGFPGKTMAQVLSSYTSTGSTPSNTVSGVHQWSPIATGGKGIYWIQAGTNDLGGGTTAAALLTTLNSLCDLAHADGYSQVIVLTVSARSDGSWSSSSESNRVTYNASLLAGSSHADRVFDTTTLLSNPSNGSWYDSGIHWKLPAHTLLAQELWAFVNGIKTGYAPYTRVTNNGGGLNGSAAYAQQFGNWLGGGANDDGALFTYGGVPVGTISSVSGTTINMTNVFSPGQEVQFTTTGTLPTGLSVGQPYWVTTATGSTFSVASAVGGTAISLSGGSGTHTVNQAEVWVAPKAGIVRVHCRLMHTYNNASDIWILNVFRNMVAAEQIGYVQGAFYFIEGTADIAVSQGDTIDIRLNPAVSSGTLGVFSNPGFSEWTTTYVK
jgi:hypothetical protein